ncbi:transketolase subunit B [Haloactinopolyspora alba]|uniref:Transketolase subunit B n=1 Tax=Haloactinopolyspora alba TaxID=648780 RepID=A0A2P8DT29_9ACTN|nr:transketolase C-terminal domain-containing protein [Haloactinopolyspora alba]PSL00355.1 transketolase subunit B [Haloactinopolyspora alba]
MTTALERQLHDCRETWAATLTDLARNDRDIVAVVNDSVGSSKLNAFQTEFSDRVINVGIAEQDMVGVGAGLANGGKIPFVSAAACFLTARALEQIKVDAAYSESNIKLIGQSPGMAYGELGPTHHSIEDLAWLRAIPGLTVIVPADRRETAEVIRWAAEHPGPVFVRVSRMPVPDVMPEDYRFVPGHAVTLRDGRDVTIAATGTVVSRALEAAELAGAEGIDVRVLAVPTIKPFDNDAIVRAARETAGIVTLEEASVVGGLGGVVAETVVRRHPAPVRILGVPDEFAPTGSASWLLDHYGVNATEALRACRELVATE